jgi:hypothetical protein
LGRQTLAGGFAPGGSAAPARLDPTLLPVRFTASDARADGRVRDVELARDQVVIRRTVKGMPLRIRVPVTAFTGVTLRLEAADESGERTIVSLEHRDPALSVTLYEAEDNEDAVAEWQMWSRVLARPLLVADLAGAVSEPFPTLGGVRLNSPVRRRRRRTPVHTRRPRRALRRRLGIASAEPAVYSEREIIARN